MEADGTFERLPKKEVALLVKQRDRLQKFLGKQLFDDFDDEEEQFWLSRMVDVDNDDVSQTQKELWKKGEEKLFVQSIGMNVKINGTPINCGMLKKLIFSTENA